MSRSGRIVILSDTHLGRPNFGGQSPESLRPLWQGAQRLIFNGDTAEIHLPDYRVAAAKQVLAIQQLCEADGVEVAFLPGNHDPLISERRHLTLCDGEVFVTHGDALHPAISPWTSHRRDLRRFHDYTLDALGDMTRDWRRQRKMRGSPALLDAKLDAAAYASHFTWDDQYWHEHHGPSSRLRQKLAYGMKVARVLWYWQTLPKRAARFAREFAPEARFFVFGHIHRAGIWRRGGQTLINTGSYDFPVNPRVVVIENGELRVHRAEWHAAYRLSAKPIAAFPLRNAA